MTSKFKFISEIIQIQKQKIVMLIYLIKFILVTFDRLTISLNLLRSKKKHFGII